MRCTGCRNTLVPSICLASSCWPIRQSLSIQTSRLNTPRRSNLRGRCLFLMSRMSDSSKAETHTCMRRKKKEARNIQKQSNSDVKNDTVGPADEPQNKSADGQQRKQKQLFITVEEDQSHFPARLTLTHCSVGFWWRLHQNAAVAETDESRNASSLSQRWSRPPLQLHVKVQGNSL